MLKSSSARKKKQLQRAMDVLSELLAPWRNCLASSTLTYDEEGEDNKEGWYPKGKARTGTRALVKGRVRGLNMNLVERIPIGI